MEGWWEAGGGRGVGGGGPESNLIRGHVLPLLLTSLPSPPHIPQKMDVWLRAGNLAEYSIGMISTIRQRFVQSDGLGLGMQIGLPPGCHGNTPVRSMAKQERVGCHDDGAQQLSPVTSSPRKSRSRLMQMTRGRLGCRHALPR